MEFPLRNTHDLRITHQKAIKDVTSHDLLFHIFPNGLKDGARITGYVMRHRDTVDSYPLLSAHENLYNHENCWRYACRARYGSILTTHLPMILRSSEESEGASVRAGLLAVVVGLSSLSPAQYIARTVWPYQRRPNVPSRQLSTAAKRGQPPTPPEHASNAAQVSHGRQRIQLEYSSMAMNWWMGAVRSHQRKQCRFNLRRLSQNALVRARGGCSARSQPRRIGTVVRWLPALIVTSRSGL